MRKLLIGLLVVLALGATGVAAAYSPYWTQSGPTYTCTGIPSGVECKDKYGIYNVVITKSYVGLYRGANQPVAGCKRGYGAITTSCFASPSIIGG